jgi:hypothetical protein
MRHSLLTLAAAVAFAADYSPALSPGAFTLPRRCWVEEKPTGPHDAQLTYFYEWEDERHPSRVADGVYRLFRRLYYGSPADVEYVRVTVTGGKATRLEFEQPEIHGWRVKHLYRSLDFSLDGAHPALRVASWNHLFEPAGAEDKLVALPCEPLDAATAKKLRFSRRSRPPA